MGRTRLRTRLVLSLIFTTALLSGASLLIVQNYLRRHARLEIYEQVPIVLETFQESARQWQKPRQQSVLMSADLPLIRALMTTKHAKTIQDASASTWQMTGGDLFVLADPQGRVMALHSPVTGVLTEISLARFRAVSQ